MPRGITSVSCKTALTGDGVHCRLNPYVGCTHRCAYCYATYVAGYRRITEPWGAWVLVKQDIVSLLRRIAQDVRTAVCSLPSCSPP